MEAIILAGGFGTRLKSVVSNVPKPMAPMDDKGTPFLQLMIDTLATQGVDHVILATGYKSEIIESYFGKHYKDVKITYSVEKEPLLTGGAIKRALKSCKDENVVVLNGDTFFDVDLRAMLAKHEKNQAKITLAVKRLEDFSRYGTIEFDSNSIITAFVEKKECKVGWINGGIYIVHRELLNVIEKESFSFEHEFLEKFYKDISLFTFKSDGYFVDIGIPEDYLKAQQYYKNKDMLLV